MATYPEKPTELRVSENLERRNALKKLYNMNNVTCSDARWLLYLRIVSFSTITLRSMNWHRFLLEHYPEPVSVFSTPCKLIIL